MQRAYFSSLLACLSTAISLFAADSVVVFNELMVHPQAADNIEWIELHNQMAVDVELSNWTLDGVTYTFPTNTIIAGGAYLVVASDPAALKARTGQTNILGPFTGRLDNSGERLELLNHNHRVMDSMRFEEVDPWPEGTAGTGFSMGKIRPTFGSAEPQNWVTSAERGGTPGRLNFAQGVAANSLLITEIDSTTNSPIRVELANLGSSAIDLSGYEFAFERAMERTNLLAAGTVLNPGAYAVVTVATDGYRPRVDEKLFLLGPGRERFVDAVTLKERPRARESSAAWFYPPGETFGNPNTATPSHDVVINEIMYRNQPLEPRPAEYAEEEVVAMASSWKFFQGATAPSGWNQPAFVDASWSGGPALLGSETASLPEPIRTQLTLGRITYYFRTEFNFTGDTNGAEFFIEHVIDDGAVFYLNGREIYRFNMPEGPVTSTTTASPGVSDAVRIPVAVPATSLVSGKNLLAVEVHQGTASSSDVVFGCRVGLRKLVRPAQTFAESTENWLELYNKGSNAVNLAAWQIKGVDYTIPTNTILAAGEYLVIAQDAATLQAQFPGTRIIGDFGGRLSGNSEQIDLIDATGNTIDSVTYHDSAPWPEFANGRGASLELRDPRMDNSKAEAWTASAESGEWQTYTYNSVARADYGPTRWNEFVFGLLDAGEVLLDDFSVIENPGTSDRELLQNGDFENGAASWRFLGTHRNASVVTDPANAANKVLRLIADGPTEHMHNHVETTLAGNVPIQNGSSYRISFRAKMLGGCNKLNTRLYFNRAARTTVLQTAAGGGTPGRRNSAWVANAGPTFRELKHSPTVPVSGQTTQITVQIEDADGIAGAKLWWSTGSTWTSLDMTGTNGRYTATLPGQSAARVVHFYIEAADSLGATAFFPREGPNSRALYKVNDGQTLSSRLHNFRLIMLPAEATALHAATNVMSNGRSLCTVIYDDSEVFYNCGLHLQSSERGRMDPNRVGFTVEFPANQPFRGVHQNITFDRSGGYSGRGGRQDEILLRHMINQAGDSPDMYDDLARVLTPLNTHTGTALLLMAKYGDAFIDGSVYEKDGGLFKLELIYYPVSTVGNNPQAPKIPQPDEVTGQDIGNLGDDPELYRWFLLAENKPWRNDYSQMMELAKAFSLSGAALEKRTSELMDMDQWTRVFAFKVLSGDPDTYGFGLTHNQLIYVPPQGKALTFPWDMDFAWTRSPTEGLNVGSRIGQIIHGIPANQRLFLGHVDDILRSSFNTNYMARWAAHYGSLAGQNYGNLLTWIGQRANAARNLLPAPVPFALRNWTGQNLLVTNTEITLQGTAPFTLKRLQRNDDPPGTGFSWLDRDNWETRSGLAFGENTIAIVGYNFRNQPVVTNTISVTSTTPFGRPDSDGDGMPDDWEAVNGLAANSPDAVSDPDGDGLSNLSEYLAGTMPLEPASSLNLEATRLGTEIDLSFTAKAGRAYKIQSRQGLARDWSDVARIPAGSQDRTIEHSEPIGVVTNTLFFRLLLDIPN